MEVIRVYTDGSSSSNGKKNCLSGCGVYFLDQDVGLSLSSQEACDKCSFTLEGHSNNVGELLGILVALYHVTDKTRELVIHSDSMYCINAITVWHHNWATRGWITAGGTPVKNKNLIKRILDEKKKFKGVFFKHVKGHALEPEDKTSEKWRDWYGNDQADKLATGSVHGRVS